MRKGGSANVEQDNEGKGKGGGGGGGGEYNHDVEQVLPATHLVGLPALQGLLGEGLLALGESELRAAVPLIRSALGLVVLVLKLLLGGDDLMGRSSREAGRRGGVGGAIHERGD